jgi:hypothetical protein
VARAEALWQRYEAVTHDTAMELCEQLRLILEPTLAAKMRGDYRTGKRVNMRKVIAYVASQFKKDKIWLRRTKPSARQYQVLLAIDDSASMADNGAGPMALESLATIATAMARLEVGQIGVARFGERFELVHALDEPFATPSSGAQCVARFSFKEQQTNMLATMATAVQTLLAARAAGAEQCRVRAADRDHQRRPHVSRARGRAALGARGARQAHSGRLHCGRQRAGAVDSRRQVGHVRGRRRAADGVVHRRVSVQGLCDSALGRRAARRAVADADAVVRSD